jgi:four helix bundle protein
MTKPEIRMNDEARMTKEVGDKTPYDLEERTARFGESIITFAKTIPSNDVTRPIICQLVRAGTSVGANYCEADDSDSKKDFRFKVGLCRREARETKHWLRMIVAAEPQLRENAKELWREAKESNLIFGAIRCRM